MQLRHLGAYYTSATTDVTAPESGLVGKYRGVSVSFKAPIDQSHPVAAAMTYRGATC